MKYFISFLMCAGLLIAAQAQPGVLDNSFGMEGTVTGEGYTGDCQAIAVQADGKIIVAGFGISNDTSGFLLVRYNTDGSADLSFGKESIIVTSFPGAFEIAGLAIQPDGKILTGGYVPGLLRDDIHIALIRYNPDGSLDSSFGANGIVNSGDVVRRAYVRDMALQPDGKIVVAGMRNDDENDYDTAFIARYNPDGSPDKSFADEGKLLTGVGTLISITSVAVQRDGKILIGGNYELFDGFLIARFLPDGMPDREFGNNGNTTFDFPGIIGSLLYDIALQGDGKIVAAGSTQPENLPELDLTVNMTLLRLEVNGKVDNSFGEGKGFIVTEFGQDGSEARKVLIQPDGKIIAAGYGFDPNPAQTYGYFALARYENNGKLDPAFGNNGLQSTRIHTYDEGTSAAFQEDGKIIVAGNTYLSAPNFVLARYNNDVILPLTYTNLTAEQEAQNIVINWQTVKEINNSYFGVERSNNAINYNEIAQVKSLASNAGVNNYSYKDIVPATGKNYYRLKQVDADGSYSYSKVISINYLKPGTIKAYPNPAKEKLTIEGMNAAKNSTVSVYDMQGKLLHQFKVKAGAHTFDISRLASGTYIVKVKDDNGIATAKFLKK